MIISLKKIYHYFLAVSASWYYGRPARKLIVIGVTGTKGKSTTCRLIASVLEAGGYTVGLLSTVDIKIGKEEQLNKFKMTMLGRGMIHKFLKKMVMAGCQYAVVETSSEGILQYRHIGLDYDVVVFTNLYPEHIESHGGFENLKKCKGKIFSNLKNKIIKGKKIPTCIIANADDDNYKYFSDFKSNEKYFYSLENKKDFICGMIDKKSDGVFTVENQKYQLNLLGKFNLYNAMAAVCAGKSQKIAPIDIAKGLSNVKLVSGRMEYIDEGQDYDVVVDYAHEPIGLAAALQTLKDKLKSDNKLIAIVGSDGGGRDVGKRAKIGEVAAKLADIVIVTDVNCFDEDPNEIAKIVAQGALKVGNVEGKNLIIEIDRKLAIMRALKLAKKDDTIIITAKGTEPCIVQKNGHKVPWDDREITRQLLKNK